MRKQTTKGALLLSFGCALLQAQVHPQYRLQVASETTTPEAVRALVGPFRCDAKGNFYFRSVGPAERPRAAARSIKKLGPNGSVQTRYQSPDAELDLLDFAVSADGELRAIAAAPHKLYLVSFDKSGGVSSKTELDLLFKPKQLVVFDNGSFLVSGSELPTSHNGAPPKPITAVFSPDGKLARRISLPKRKNDDRETASSLASDDAAEGIDPAVEFGAAVAGSDGNAYLLRHTYPATVHVISPWGEVLRTLKVEPPYKGMKPNELFYSDGRLLLVFTDERQVGIMAVDAQSGEPLAEYLVPDELGAAVACYEGNEIAFLHRKGSKLTIVRTAVQ